MSRMSASCRLTHQKQRGAIAHLQRISFLSIGAVMNLRERKWLLKVKDTVVVVVCIFQSEKKINHVLAV